MAPRKEPPAEVWYSTCPVREVSIAFSPGHTVVPQSTPPRFCREVLFLASTTRVSRVSPYNNTTHRRSRATQCRERIPCQARSDPDRVLKRQPGPSPQPPSRPKTSDRVHYTYYQMWLMLHFLFLLSFLSTRTSQLSSKLLKDVQRKGQHQQPSSSGLPFAHYSGSAVQHRDLPASCRLSSR